MYKSLPAYSLSVIGEIKTSIALHSFGWWMTKWIAGDLSLDTITYRPSWIKICKLWKARAILSFNVRLGFCLAKGFKGVVPILGTRSLFLYRLKDAIDIPDKLQSFFAVQERSSIYSLSL